MQYFLHTRKMILLQSNMLKTEHLGLKPKLYINYITPPFPGSLQTAI